LCRRGSSILESLGVVSGTIGAGTLTNAAFALSVLASTLASAVCLLLLQLCQASRLVVDVQNLLLGLGVEVDKLLASWGTSSLLVVGSQAREEGAGLLGNTVGLVDRLGLVGGMVLLIKVVESGKEAAGNSVLAVKLNGTLDSLVANDVAVSKVFSDDTAAGLLLLCDLVAVTLRVFGVVAAIVLVGARGADNLDLGRSELGVVEQEGSLGSSLLLEDYCSILSLAGWSDIDLRDLATEGEEILDFLLGGSLADVLDVNGGGRHDCCVGF